MTCAFVRSLEIACTGMFKSTHAYSNMARLQNNSVPGFESTCTAVQTLMQNIFGCNMIEGLYTTADIKYFHPS